MKIKLLTLAILALTSAATFADRPGQSSSERASNQQHRAERAQRQHQVRPHRDARTVSREVTRTKTDAGFERHSTATNARGQVASRDTVVTRDAESKTRTRETSGQRFDGTSYSSSAVVQKTDAGHTRNLTRTNADGDIATRTTNVTRDAEARTVTRDSSGQNFAGESYSANSVRQKTDNGYTSTSERTKANGDTLSRSVVATVDRDNGTASKEITRVNADGESTSRTVEVSINKSGQ